jgi:hypothetical protein
MTTCADCFFSSQRNGLRYCVRNPPAMVATNAGPAWGWPTVKDEWWCGMYCEYDPNIYGPSGTLATGSFTLASNFNPIIISETGVTDRSRVIFIPANEDAVLWLANNSGVGLVSLAADLIPGKSFTVTLVGSRPLPLGIETFQYVVVD